MFWGSATVYFENLYFCKFKGNAKQNLFASSKQRMTKKKDKLKLEAKGIELVAFRLPPTFHYLSASITYTLEAYDDFCSQRRSLFQRSFKNVAACGLSGNCLQKDNQRTNFLSAALNIKHSLLTFSQILGCPSNQKFGLIK